MARLRTATPAEVRQWAQDNGYEVGDRGRISSEIAEAFNKAHKRNSLTFVPGDRQSTDTALSVTGMRRGKAQDGKQVFEVDVTGTLTFTVPA